MVQLRKGGYTVITKEKMEGIRAIEDSVSSQDNSLDGVEEDNGMERAEAREFKRKARAQSCRCHGCELYADYQQAEQEMMNSNTGRGTDDGRPWDVWGKQLQVQCGNCLIWQITSVSADGKTEPCEGCTTDAAIMENQVLNGGGSGTEGQEEEGANDLDSLG